MSKEMESLKWMGTFKIPEGHNETAVTVSLDTPEKAAEYLKASFPDDMALGEGVIGSLANKLRAGNELTSDDKKILEQVLPIQVSAIKIDSKSLSAGQMWDLGNSYGDANISLEIDTLTMDTGSYIKCAGKALNLTINNLVKKHSSYSSNIPYDIGVFGNDGTAGSAGADGVAGANGAAGTNGTNWSPGIAGDDGGPGKDGAPGKHGGNGGNGLNGSEVIAANITIKNLTEPITVAAIPGNGGKGGKGGNGGNGGSGGKGGNGCDTGCEGSNGGDGGNGGNGGDGGNGGSGGNGGNGGTVNIYVKQGAKALINTICSLPNGGNGGVEGHGGAVGDGGGKGTGGKHHSDGNPGSNGTTAGKNGSLGTAGNPGTRAVVNISEKTF